MADIFISYSKASRALTKSLADELEMKGYMVWWDTGLLPGESFSDVIISELEKARAAIVIWTPDSIKSQWVRSEARRASLRGILIPVRDDRLDPNDIPPPFDNLHTDLISNRVAIFAALSRLGVVPPAPAPKSPEPLPPPKSDADIAEMVAIEHWQAIKTTSDPGRLREFLAEFGASKVARLARDRIVSLEEEAWRQLPKRRTVDALNTFLEEFPDGRYASAAAAAIAELKAAHTPKAVPKAGPKPVAPRMKDAMQVPAVDAGSARWLQVILGMGCMAVIANVQYGWSLFTGPMSRAQGWALTDIGFAFSIYVFAQALLIPMPGYLVDRFGPKWVVGGGAALVALAGILNGSANSLAVLYLGSAVGGIGTGAVYAAAVGSTLKWFEDQRGLAVGLVTCGFGIIAPLSVMLVASTIELWGYRSTFLFWGIAHSVALALMALFMRAPRQLAASASAHQSDRGGRPTDMVQAPTFWILYGIFVVIAVASPIMRNQFFAITTELHIPRESLVWVYSISGIALGLSQPLFGWISDRFGRENSMGAAFALAAVAIAALWVLPQNEGTVSLVYCIASFAGGAATVLFPVACADLFGKRFAGTNYGLLHTAKGVGLFLGNAMIAASALALTDWTVVAAVAVLNLIGAIAAMVVLKPLARKQAISRP